MLLMRSKIRVFEASASSTLSIRCLPTITQRSFSSTIHRKDSAAEVKITDRLTMKGKTVLVTGGGRGIGLAICKAVAQLGGNIAVLDALPQPAKEFHTLSHDYGIETIYE